MRLPRFTTRRMMSLVAVVGVAFAGIAALGRHWQWVQHGESLRKISTLEMDARELAEELKRRIPEDPAHFKYWSAYYAAEEAEYARRRRRIQREMALPWEPVLDSRDPGDE